MNSKKYLIKSLADFLLPENEPVVLQGARGISVIDLSTEQHKTVVIPVVADSNILGEATLSLLRDETYGRYGLFKVQGEYHSITSGVNFLSQHFSSGEDRTIWSAYRMVDMPVELSAEDTTQWCRSPNRFQGDLSVNLEKEIFFGDGRTPLIAKDGKVFMQIYCDNVLPIKTFLTPSELAYVNRLQIGK